MKIFYVFTRSAICLQMPLPFDVILVNFSSIVLFSMLLQTCNNSFYCFCLFVYYFGPEVAKSIKIGFYMKGLSMWCPKMIKNHVLGISLLMVSLDFWSEKFDPPYCVAVSNDAYLNQTIRKTKIPSFVCKSSHSWVWNINQSYYDYVKL